MATSNRPLDPIFRPHSVAVVGASRSRQSLGWAIVHNLVDFQFAGAIYPVNPKADAIHSLKCYPSLSAIPDPIDLAIVTVPQPLVAAIVDEGLTVGVGGFVVITAGFAEVGRSGSRGRSAAARPGARGGRAHDRPELHGRDQHRGGRRA